ncbi:glycosyltransferase family 4 protein [Paucibacter sp. XJ19-41]|uniref:glycosyltransferase family 4 protein n=1 Tax=Paucibacter sp. XJ19-41 TaxID=2927824 RepID=UPI00234A1F13|nr:glycosyltransferase family 4 protein [Paucibacter sp. XJ19-41]MDC6168285.1 glycosyltransferase family 4 protein [Paucibacter sp. XJ19-41]
MRLLIIHQNFPGQFKHMAADWARRPGWEVVGIGRDTAPGLPDVSELRLIRYKPHRGVSKDQHHYLRRMEDAVLHGQAVARVLLKLKAQGFRPDAILAHPGWGETLYAKDVFPDARLVHYAEWFYNAQGADIGFDPEFPVSFDDLARVRSWNALHLLNLENCDAAISPTQWQKAQHPKAYLDKITVAHEGIDTENLGPDPNARIKLPSGLVLKAGDPVVTYVARNLEPYRGFHSFMRALPAIQAEHKTCHTVIVGGDEVSYGSRPKDPRYKNWREQMLAEVGSRLDPKRTHFVGKLAYGDYKRLLQVSSAHVYLTYPFVLSWSCLEAMASGCLVIGSDTAPVREVLQDGVNGVMEPFGDERRLADQIVHGLVERRDGMRAEARRMVRSGFARDSGEASFMSGVAPWARAFLAHQIDQDRVSASTHQVLRDDIAEMESRRV